MIYISTGEQVVDVHNVYTLYESDSADMPNQLSFCRPQDWGDPKWNYEFLKLEWKLKDTIYINNAHVWTTTKLDPPEILAAMGQAIGMIMQPGKPSQLCGRTHLDIDDFWDDDWGEMPPVFDRNEYDLQDYFN